MSLVYQLEPRHFFGREPVAFWEGFFTDEEINEILAQPEWVSSKPSVVLGGDEGGVVDEKIRISENSWWVPNERNSHLWAKLAAVVSQVNAQFFNFDLTGMHEPAQLTVYNGADNGNYDWHIDYAPSPGFVPRKLSMVLMLSDPEKDFTGGEFEVKPATNEPRNLELKKGRAWFFPSFMLHRVAPVTSGTRRSLVLWVGGPDFR